VQFYPQEKLQKERKSKEKIEEKTQRNLKKRKEKTLSVSVERIAFPRRCSID
jgi:hypothetical protein